MAERDKTTRKASAMIMKVLVLIIISIAIIYGIAESIRNSGQNEEHNIIMEDKEKWFEEWCNRREGYGEESIKYQVNWACDFLVYVDFFCSTDTYEFRNISTENLYKEDGDTNFGYMQQAYIADVVVDKYIREYDGKNTEYNVQRIMDKLPDNLNDIWYMEISTETTTLIALWSGYSNIVSVRITEEGRNIESKKMEFINYLRCMDENEEKITRENKNVFYLIVEPKDTEKVYYRNLNIKKRSLEAGDADYSMKYYIADQIIDRYIRDYQGKDAVYELHQNQLTNFESHEITEVVTIENDNTSLKMEYSEATWLVKVEILNGELELGRATQEDINRIGQLQDTRRLQITIDSENLNLAPLANLKNLEELSMTVTGELKNLDISFIGELGQLKKLTVVGYTGNLSFLKNLKKLEEIYFLNSEVRELSCFEELEELRKLSISDVQDTDIGNLKKLTKLEKLHLKGRHVRNFECLVEKKKLEYLYLSEVDTNSENREVFQVNILSDMIDLKDLYIVRMKIEDITPISDLPSVEKIVLVNTGIENIECLAALPKLKTLEIYGEITEKVKEQSEKYFSELERVVIENEILKHF